jgi:epoxyqueuosine reductase
LELLELDEPGFHRRFAGTPMLRAKRQGLVRNACVALGNVGDESAVPVLQKITNETQLGLTEHAHWAINQIQARARQPAESANRLPEP